MRILVVSQDIPSLSRAGSRRPYQLLRVVGRRHALSLVYPYYRSQALADVQEIEGQADLFRTVRSFDLRSRHTTVCRKVRTRLSGLCLSETRIKFPREFSQVVEAIRRLASENDVIWVTDLASMQYVDGVRTPTVLDAVDCVSRNTALRLSRLSPGWRRAVRSWLFRPLREFERSLHARATLSVVNSRVDARYMVERELGSPAVVENGCDTDHFSPTGGYKEAELPGRPVLVFVGVFRYHPNEDAARWLIQDLMPRLLVHYPQAHLVLVGPGPSPPLPVSGHVVATGFVPDVRPYYAGADVFVAPLRYGTGIKHKVLEAASMECRIVATPSAVEGLSLRHGRHLFVADCADGFVARIRDALESEEAVCMAKRARSLVDRRHSWDAQGERFEALLRKAASWRRITR
ncbi:MAG: glycosyltransferase family 4 protein [Chloroflexota bacterium]|nr:glycosyltransferase family 4 protein [Chloroflexota bacterium]